MVFELMGGAMNRLVSALLMLFIGVFFYWSAERSGYSGSFFGGLYSAFGSKVFLVIGGLGFLWEIFRLKK